MSFILSAGRTCCNLMFEGLISFHMGELGLVNFVGLFLEVGCMKRRLAVWFSCVNEVLNFISCSVWQNSVLHFKKLYELENQRF